MVQFEKTRILLIGPCPPPFGGVSIHIERLRKLLSPSFDIDIVDESRTHKPGQFNLRSFNLLTYLKKVYQADIVHIHSGLVSLRAIHFLSASLFRKKIVITIHGFDPDSNKTKNKMNQWIIDHCDKVIFVSEEISKHFSTKKFFLKEAFLPPDISSEQALPEQVNRWIDQKHQEGFVICCANAWRLDIFNNEDLYGLDICIQSAIELRSKGVKVAFFYVVCEDTGAIAIAQYRKQIVENDLAGVFYLYESPLSFIRLIKAVDIVLRPTNTDGDALTVREGLFLGKSVIASDIVSRPVGTKLFMNRNLVSLVEEIAAVSAKHDEGRISETDNNYNGTDYLSFYRGQVYTVNHQGV